MASGLHSDLTIETLNSSGTEKLGSQTQVNHGPVYGQHTYPTVQSHNLTRKIPPNTAMAHHALIKNRTFGDIVDRGYRSDNEFYADSDRNMTSTPEGYYSDWEAIGGKMSEGPRNIPGTFLNKSYMRQKVPESLTSSFGSVRHVTPSPQQFTTDANKAVLEEQRATQRLIGYDAGFDYPHVDHVSNDNSSIRNSTACASRIAASSPVPQQPRQPPDYNTALQRSSMYSNFHGPVDAAFAEESPQSCVLRPESRPNSRMSHASDAGSSVMSSSTNSTFTNRFATSDCGLRMSPRVNEPISGHKASSSANPTVQSKPSHPPPVPPKPSLAQVAAASCSVAVKQIEEAVYKELSAINSFSCNSMNDPSLNSSTHKAIPVQVVSDSESIDSAVTANHVGSDSPQQGFTPISPAPNTNMQMHNHIIHPSLPSPQQLPVKNAYGQWIFGAHKNPKVVSLFSAS